MFLFEVKIGVNMINSTRKNVICIHLMSAMFHMMACLQDKLRINGRNLELGQLIMIVAFTPTLCPCIHTPGKWIREVNINYKSTIGWTSW